MKTPLSLSQNRGKARSIDYVRISITDKCNLRCSYCMPKEGIAHMKRSEILTFEEIARLAKIFAALGIRKIRLTGGEPLVRKDITYLIRSIADIEGIEEVALTTNGILLPIYVESIKKAGIKSINISLDTLRADRFRRMTGSGSFGDIIEGIKETKRCGFDPIKLNTVIIKGVNDDEIDDFVRFGLSEGLVMRFIEFMNVTPLWEEESFLPIETIKDVCARQFDLSRIGHIGSSPAEYYRVDNRGLIGFIKTDVRTCRICNRLRLSSTGDLRICLYQERGISLKRLMRAKRTDEEIKDVVAALMGAKEHVTHNNFERAKLYMSNIGG